MKWKWTRSGDIRKRRKFLWYPRFCQDGYYRWWMWVEIEEEYVCDWGGCGWSEKSITEL